MEAVRRRSGESAQEIAVALGRTSRWVRKGAARADEEPNDDRWAEGRSRAPLSSPTRTSDELRQLIVDARERLAADPRGQYGALAVAWQQRRMGIDPIPNRWTIERVIAAAGLAKPRRRPRGYVPKGVPYPARLAPEPGTTHQIDLVGPRHLDGGVELHALNLIDIGSHTAASEILAATRPNLIADAVIAMWGRVGIPAVAQFDNASNFGGAIPPAWQHFGPVVAVCLDLDVIPRFIPQREPWRNGVVELSTTCGTRAFPARNASPASTVSEPRTKLSWRSTTPSTATRPRRGQPRRISAGRLRFHPVAAYRAPTLVPARGRIEVVRYVRSNRILDLFGKRVTLDAEDAHHVTAVIKVRSKTVQAITVDGEIVHQGDFNLARTLR